MVSTSTYHHVLTMVVSACRDVAHVLTMVVSAPRPYYVLLCTHTYHAEDGERGEHGQRALEAIDVVVLGKQ